MAGTLTTLHSFCSQGESTGCPDGSGPNALIQAADGHLYGTTGSGGSGTGCDGAACGTVFKITASGTLTTLYAFCSQGIFGDNCPDGDEPNALTQAADGNSYGITVNGGPNIGCPRNFDGYGTVFKITPSGGLTTVYSFCAQTDPDGRCIDGSVPNGLLLATDGDLYGTTAGGGASAFYGGYSPNEGTVSKITPAGILTTLYSLCSRGNGCADGEQPEGMLVQSREWYTPPPDAKWEQLC
jgi:uncharacterized repeat protein (TIGR03803 family)